MIKMLHFADLHLSARPDSKAYGFAVLEEIVGLACSNTVDAVLMAGDIFNTAADARILMREFIEYWRPYTGSKIFIPGNHEEDGDQFDYLNGLQTESIHVLSQLPFQHFLFEQSGTPYEIIALPHHDKRDLAALTLPRKTCRWRLALAHGLVPGMSFNGFDEEIEEGGSSLDPEFFWRNNVDYVALGHIHSARSQTIHDTLFNYSGSSRVWRKGERGPRTVSLVEMENELSLKRLPLTTAGEYRHTFLPVHLTDECPWPFNAQETTAADFVEVILSGLFNDELSCANFENKWLLEHGHKLRKVVFNRRDVLYYQNLAHLPFTKEFLQHWAAKKPTAEAPDYEMAQAAWLKARCIALQLIKDFVKEPP